MVELRPNSIRVAVVNSFPFWREGLARILDLYEDIKVTGEYSEGSEFLWAMLQSSVKVDVVIINQNLSGMSGLELCKEIQEFKLNVNAILIAESTDMLYIENAYNHGVKGYLQGTISLTELHRAIHIILKDGIYFNEVYTSKLVSHLLEKSSSHSKLQDYPKFSILERKIIKLVCQSYKDKEIADIIGKSYGTVSKAKARIMKKMMVNSRVGITMYAVQNGLNL